MCLSSRACRVRRCGCSSQQVPASGRYLFVKHCSIHRPRQRFWTPATRENGIAFARLGMGHLGCVSGERTSLCDATSAPSLGPVLRQWSWMGNLHRSSSSSHPMLTKVGETIGACPGAWVRCFPYAPPPFPQPQGCMMTDPDEEALPCGCSDT